MIRTKQRVVKQYSLNALYQLLTPKQKEFCKEYIRNGWVGTRAYMKVYGNGYNTSGVESCRLLKNPKIKQFIAYMREEYEQLCHVSKARQIHEYTKIAYSNMDSLYTGWMTLKKFKNLPPEVKACIESIETKSIPSKLGMIEFVKVKLFSKIDALAQIDKLMGYLQPKKFEIENNHHLNIDGVGVDMVRKAMGLTNDLPNNEVN
jgi:hypothetical protein